MNPNIPAERITQKQPPEISPDGSLTFKKPQDNSYVNGDLPSKTITVRTIIAGDVLMNAENPRL
jgi:hypothetical protein